MSAETFPFIDALDREQREAAVVETSAAVSAGAGAGKTRVLAARYGWLIMSGRCEVGEILTITFTNKAANEMYSRIYELLSRYAQENHHARRAVENFHQARIQTLDSFSAAVARAACRRFGVSPDFTSGDARIREMARSLALRFVLDKRDDPALRGLIAEKKIRVTADKLFVEPLLDHSPLSRPLDFKALERVQREEARKRWNELSRRAAGLIAGIREKTIPQDSAFAGRLSRVLSHEVEAPAIEALLEGGESAGPPGAAPPVQARSSREALARYIAFLAELRSLKTTVYKNDDAEVMAVKDSVGELKNDLYEKLEALAGLASRWDLVRAVFPLIEEYQALLNQKKREAGILTFTDVAHLAVDSLRLHGDIREMYRRSFKAIMIDEFQDNNGLQRDLVDLLADPARVFYVGDEKQSIYRFRGADVSVFRELLDRTERRLSLNRNYRSHPSLIRVFNLIFGGYRSAADPDPLPGVFPPEGTGGLAPYEASYRWIYGGPGGEEAPAERRLRFAFLDAGRLEPSQAADCEAAYIARKIKAMVGGGERIFDRRENRERPCGYGDFAVLQRRYTHQHALERQFKILGVPFSADRPAGLLSDAPVNDLRVFLKLLVYPDDRIAYAALLRSPFVRLSDEGFALCALKGEGVFDPALDGELSPEDRERYREGRRAYRETLEASRDLPVSALITRLWYDYGYRYETLWSSSSQAYGDLYDLFYAIARTVEDQGKGLTDFLDYLEALAEGEGKADDSALPGEEESGARLMSIHRCKGLEFPVVFVYGCGHGEDTSLERELTLFSETWGLSLNLPPAEELLPLEGPGDYFYLLEKEEHRKKSQAELRRLFYVAMTRAESALFVTAAIPKQTKAEREELDPGSFDSEDAFIAARFEQYRAREDIASVSFLRLLPRLEGENPLYAIEAIPGPGGGEPPGIPRRREGRAAPLSMEEAALRARAEYEEAPPPSPPPRVPRIIAASSLQVKQNTPLPAAASPGTAKPDGTAGLPGGLKSEDFGTIVHGFIEDLFNRRPPRIPPRYAALIGSERGIAETEAAARSMAEGFFNAPLGRKALAASFRKTEYAILSAVDLPGAAGAAPDRVLISGKIDLLFDDGEAVYVVDFKTDRDEDPLRHAGQLAVYQRAVEDIFAKPVKARLFYLRSGHEVVMDSPGLSPEALAALWEREE
ncbi:MAG: UvrD-helicase domain-containing protein [Treponema sp.]|nr:UvrD-helicase domain-containing protein [Treponema sp.]